MSHVIDRPRVDWPEARRTFEQGASKREVARRYGVTRQAVQQRAQRDRWDAHNASAQPQAELRTGESRP